MNINLVLTKVISELSECADITNNWSTQVVMNSRFPLKCNLCLMQLGSYLVLAIVLMSYDNIALSLLLRSGNTETS